MNANDHGRAGGCFPYAFQNASHVQHVPISASQGPGKQRLASQRDETMKLTKDRVPELPLDGDKSKADVIYFDDDLKGFGIRFRTGGKPTWLIQYRDATGNTRRN